MRVERKGGGGETSWRKNHGKKKDKRRGRSELTNREKKGPTQKNPEKRRTPRKRRGEKTQD